MASARREAFGRWEEHMRGRQEEGEISMVPWLEEAELDVGEQERERWNDLGFRPPQPARSSSGYREWAGAVPVATARATPTAGCSSGGCSKRRGGGDGWTWRRRLQGGFERRRRLDGRTCSRKFQTKGESYDTQAARRR
jgi:hypothetical protein